MTVRKRSRATPAKQTRAAKKPAKKPTKKPTKKPAKQLQRPAAWWRVPIPPAKLAGLSDDEKQFLIAQERLLRIEKIKDDIRILRQFSHDFTAAHGYPLRTHELIRLHPTRARKLHDAVMVIRRAQAKPNIVLTPKNARQKKTAKQRAGQLIPGQKKFILHPNNANATARFVDKGRVIEIVTPIPGRQGRGDKAIFARQYLFPRRPRSWDDVADMSADLQKVMRPGAYRLITTQYGTIAELVQREKLTEILDGYLASYNKGFAETILGWEWLGDNFTSARKRVAHKKTVEERWAAVRKQRQQAELDRVKDRLGIQHPKRRAPKQKPSRKR